MNCNRSSALKVAVSDAPSQVQLEATAGSSSHSIVSTAIEVGTAFGGAPQTLWRGRKRQHSTRCLGLSGLGFREKKQTVWCAQPALCGQREYCGQRRAH